MAFSLLKNYLHACGPKTVHCISQKLSTLSACKVRYTNQEKNLENSRFHVTSATHRSNKLHEKTGLFHFSSLGYVNEPFLPSESKYQCLRANLTATALN